MELDIIKTQTTWNDAAGSINNNFEKLRLSVEEGGGSSVTVDTEVSDTSTNPIANKSIKKYVDDNKVAKVEGKQLSTEDFTTALKQKLDGLTNYDDAEVKNAIEALESNLDAILNGNASGAIENINEILAFLSTIADTDTLAGIVANLQGLIAANTTKIGALEDSVDAELAKRPEPLIIEVGIDFPSETATGTIADFAVSYETVKAAMESGSNIELVEANGNRHSCTFFYDDGENGIIVRATTHTTNESHIRMLVFTQGTSVVVWRSNYHILQEQLVSGENIATVNGQSLLEGGNIVVEGGGIAEEVEVYIGDTEPTDDGAKLWVDTDEEDEPSQPSASVWNGGIYFLPIGLAESIHNGEEYVFTNAEAEALRKVVANFSNTIFAVHHPDAQRGTMVVTASQVGLGYGDLIDLNLEFFGELGIIEYLQSNSILVWEDEEGYIRSYT